ncbi:MAG: hypothetical protein ACREAM_15785 [Blastocatellia bacterium]
MEAIRQIYEKLPEMIAVPDEMRDRYVKVIFQPLEPTPELEPDLEAIAARFGLKLEEVADLHALKFMGCLPDFPPRAPQGEYEIQPELDLL